MEIVIIAIGTVVVLGIAGLFVFKKLQTQKSELPILPQMPQPSARPAPVADTINELATAEAHIRNQNYQEAINELKRILMTNPRHNGAMLKLLQTYGVTKQFSAFNQLHQKIHEIADGETIREADFCKSLLEEEMANANTAISQPVMPVTPNVVVPVAGAIAATVATPTQSHTQQAQPNAFDNGLDFDFAAPTTSAPITPNAAASDGNINSLDFNLETLDAPIAPALETPKVEPKTEPSAFDMDDLGELDFNLPSQPTPAQQSAEPSPDFDGLSFDTPVAPIMPAGEPSLEFDGLDDLESLDADFSLDATPTSVAQSSIQEPNDFGFDLDPPETSPASNATPTAEPSLNTATSLDADFDFNFDTPSTSVVSTAPTETLSDFGDFNLDISTPASATSAESQPIIDEPTTDFGEFDLGLGLDTTPPSAQPVTSADNLESLDLEDFSIEEPTISQAPEITKESVLDFGDFDLGLADTPVVETTIESSTTTSDDGLDFGDFDLGLETKSEDIVPAVNISSTTTQTPSSVAFSSLDNDFGADLALDAISTKDIQSSNDELNSDGFNFSDTPAIPLTESEPVTPAEPVIASIPTSPTPPTPAQSARLPSELNFVDELDNTDVVLNLAKQYLGLGEYDSAKRLLNEVVHSGNTNQQQAARQLMSELT